MTECLPSEGIFIYENSLDPAKGWVESGVGIDGNDSKNKDKIASFPIYFLSTMIIIA